MTFEEIFDDDGLYVSDGFAKGVCFRIKNGNCLLASYFEDKPYWEPVLDPAPLYKGLFSKTFVKIDSVKELFDNYESNKGEKK